jgi:high frequency lysogenization protein
LSVVWQRRALALAGLVQTVHLVSSVARTGIVAQDVMEASLASVFVQNPDSISEIYQGSRGVRSGLGLTREMLQQFNLTAHGEILRYLLAVTNLERQLARDSAMLDQLGAGIARIDERRLQRDADPHRVDDESIEQLASLYEATLSDIKPRIRIAGNRQQLNIPANIHRVRALMLAAVRAAVLWHQVGGRRWQILLNRGQLGQGLDHIR